MVDPTELGGDNHIKVSRSADGILRVVIDRPAKRNALTLGMWLSLGDVFRAAAADRATRAIILTGGGGHFSAGADISEFGEVRSTAEEGLEYDRINDETALAIRDCPCPVFAAVSGVAVGGGLSLALACDFRVVHPSARMGITAGRLGLVYSVLDCRLLAERVGTTNAKRILLSASIYGFEDARQLDLVDHAAEHDPVETAETLAREMAANAPMSQAGNKMILNALADHTVREKQTEIDGMISAAFDSRDYLEGQKAFAEKRRPAFVGK